MSARAIASSVYVVSAARTPIGSFLGSLARCTATELGGAAMRGALDRARLPPDAVGEVIMGNVLSAGLRQAPARQAAAAAGLPPSVPAMTVNKVCGSSLQAVILGAQSIALGQADVVLAGGMESMSNAPYYLPRARAGYRMGDGLLVDGMLQDALRDAYQDVPMGELAERCALEFGISREAQDEYAAESYRRALAAQACGLPAEEIVPVEVPGKASVRGGGDTMRVAEDDEPKRYQPDRMRSLNPAFSPDGTITAANASKIDDAAAAVVLASERAVRERALAPLARVVAYGTAALEPERFTLAPAAAIGQALARAELREVDVDLFEINEAFAVVPIACSRRCGLDSAKVNVHGGAIALGHPVGASGARILTTLLYALRHHGARRGMAAVCIGGGEGLALLVERES